MANTTRKNNSQRKLVPDSVGQIWLAGLGALALTEEEGGRLFNTLVRRGAGFERTTRARIGKAVASARDVPGETMTRIGARFDDTMSGIMSRIGVPTQREINSLARRVEGLAASIERRTAAAAPARRPARSRRATTRRSTATATA